MRDDRFSDLTRPLDVSAHLEATTPSRYRDDMGPARFLVLWVVPALAGVMGLVLALAVTL